MRETQQPTRVHIQNDNEGFDIPTSDIVSMDIRQNVHINKYGLRTYINKVYMKIRPSENILCEGIKMQSEDFLYRFSDFNDIRSITINESTYTMPWKDREEYGNNEYQSSKCLEDVIEITIQKPFEKRERGGRDNIQKQ